MEAANQMEEWQPNQQAREEKNNVKPAGKVESEQQVPPELRMKRMSKTAKDRKQVPWEADRLLPFL